MGRLSTLKEIADIHGVTPKTVQNWLGEGMPVKERQPGRGHPHTIDSQESIEWRISKETGGGFKGSDARLKAAQAEKTELEVSEKLRELVPINEVVTDVGRMLAAFRQRILSLPGVLAPGLVKLKNVRTIERYIKERVHEALAEIAGYEPAGVEESTPKPRKSNGAAAKPNGKRVVRRKPKAKPRSKRAARKVAH